MAKNAVGLGQEMTDIAAYNVVKMAALTCWIWICDTWEHMQVIHSA